jgi:RimJ/RimL family protein N-acetyltransferase
VVELRTDARANAGPLFAGLDWHLAVPAVLADAATGAVYADRAAAPRSALLLAGHRAYLAGDPADAGFLAGLPSTLQRRFVPEGHEWGAFALYYDRPEWATAVEAAVSPGLRGYRERRRCYFVRDARADSGTAPATQLTAGFRLVPVDRTMLDDPALDERDELIEEICSERGSVEDFLARSFGMALLHDGAVVGWCLSEYNLGPRCEVGIAVDERFRRRGLAKEMGRAFALRALTAGVREIGWHCWEDNAASCATALALGFALVRTYPALMVRLTSAGAR